MCMKTDCVTCKKPTWKGCGKHIEQALKDVPEDERCKCPRDPPASTATESKETKVETTAHTEETKVETAANTEETKVEATANTEEVKDKID